MSFAVDPGGIEKYGGHCAFFHDGFQKGILASQNGTGVPAICHFHWYFMHSLVCPLGSVTPHNLSMSHAEHLRGTKLDILCHLLG